MLSLPLWNAGEKLNPNLRESKAIILFRYFIGACIVVYFARQTGQQRATVLVCLYVLPGIQGEEWKGENENNKISNISAIHTCSERQFIGTFLAWWWKSC